MFIKHLDNFLSKGTSDTNTIGINKKIKVGNLATVVSIIINLTFLFQFTLNGEDIAFWFTLAMTTLLSLMLPLAHRGHHVFTRTFTISHMFTYPYLHSLYFGRTAGTLLINFTLISIIFIVFDFKEERKVIYSLFLVCLGSAMYLEFNDHHVFNSTYIEKPLAYQIDYFRQTYITCALGIFIGSYWINKENYETEKKLEEAIEEAEASTKTKADFLSVMSHEIRTPLNGIIGLLDVLNKDKTDLDRKLQVLNTSANSLLYIVNDILDFSKMDAQKLKLEEHPFSVRSEISAIQEIVRTRTEEKLLDFRINISNQIPDTVIGDATRLNQVLMNLLDNAVKFTEKGIIELNVYHSSDEGEKVVLSFEVIDTGIGIPNHKIDQIFNSFTQATLSTTRKYGGTGLGITICKMLIELQGGKMQVHSRPNIGSNFKFTLPLKKHMEREYTQKSEITTPPTNETQINALFVEDNEINQFVTIQLFKLLNIKHDVYDNAVDALESSLKTKYDIIITDYHMPNMSGIELSEAIKRNKENLNYDTPILLLTADALSSLDKKCQEVGIDDILIKPIDQKEFRAKILKFSSIKELT